MSGSEAPGGAPADAGLPAPKPRRGLVLGGPTKSAQTLDYTVGGVDVTVTCMPYNPIAEEAARLKVSKAARGVEDGSELIELLAPEGAEAILAADPITMEATASVYLGVVLGTERVVAWSGMVDPEGNPVPFDAALWQLACFTVPRFAAAFLTAYLAPRTAEILAGNASAPAPNGPSAAGAPHATDAGSA